MKAGSAGIASSLLRRKMKASTLASAGSCDGNSVNRKNWFCGTVTGAVMSTKAQRLLILIAVLVASARPI
jgi:hypothetical protein